MLNQFVFTCTSMCECVCVRVRVRVSVSLCFLFVCRKGLCCIFPLSYLFPWGDQIVKICLNQRDQVLTLILTLLYFKQYGWA